MSFFESIRRHFSKDEQHIYRIFNLRLGTTREEVCVSCPAYDGPLCVGRGGDQGGEEALKLVALVLPPVSNVSTEQLGILFWPFFSTIFDPQEFLLQNKSSYSYNSSFQCANIHIQYMYCIALGRKVSTGKGEKRRKENSGEGRRKATEGNEEREREGKEEREEREGGEGGKGGKGGKGGRGKRKEEREGGKRGKGGRGQRVREGLGGGREEREKS